MKLILIILLLFSSFAHGQRPHGKSINPFDQPDSLELLNSNSPLKHITDTLPLFALDENNGWRDMKLVKYFYDSLISLKIISFKNGTDSNYYFYFEGTFLRKAIIRKQNNLMQFNFTVEHNKHTSLEIEQIATQDPKAKDFYQLLRMGKAFFGKFKTLIQIRND